MKTNTQPTLLQAVEKVVELSEGTELSEQFMKKARLEIDLLANAFGITPIQAVLFCVCMEEGPRNVDYDDLARHLQVNKIRMMGHGCDIDALVRRRLLYYNCEDADSFGIHANVLRCLRRNEVYELPKRTELDCTGMFEWIRLWFEDLDNHSIDPRALSEELQTLIEENQQTLFARQLRSYHLELTDQLLVVLFCHKLVEHADEDIRFHEMECVYKEKVDFIRAQTHLCNGAHILQKMNIVEFLCENGMASNSRFKLTEQAKRNLLAEMHITHTDIKLPDVMESGSLVEKSLFFSRDIQRQVDELGTFLQADNFRKVQERMHKKGFRNGFACLFYGGPGTGKTETVYQLAKRSGRNIMVVDVPNVKSKWVGDSEKNIKAIFEHYRKLNEHSKQTAILLFNEADAILGIRQVAAETAVDKMENSIQNIILQEMESLDGIMIATTNLQQNLDKAFERRFLYKIKFEKPTQEARAHIWKTMIPELSETERQILASKYDFSGGEIENIARHYTIDTILHGTEQDTLSMLIRHCDNERLDSKEQQKIGFV